LTAGASQVSGNYEYTFAGVRSVTGITVRRDPGSTIIWVATALLLFGLAMTFYLPRRRLWVRITPERTFMAGVADRIVNFSAEMRRIGAAAGAPDAQPTDDDW
ncbi:MAG: cytochrome c biogenesis protein ResB, partial [Dehalococcoidia bacterium]